MKKVLIALALLSLGPIFAQNTLHKVNITATEYDQLKKEGKLDPHINYQIDMLTLPQVRRDEKPITPTTITSTKSAGNCACYIAPDATWTLAMAPNDDGSTGMLTLPFNFCLYGTNYTNFWINNNGNVTFDSPYGTFSSVGFPSATYVMVAPFWGDVDTRGAGQVWYKITPTALYVNWVGVGYFNTQSDLLNTFSLVITNGNDPVIGVGNNVAFCYQDMQWTTGSASGGIGGFGGVPATVGANKGDGISFVQYGRFDQPGAAYDGPVGANDGVSWLDNQSLIFNACSNTNISPTLSADVPLCDTIEICLGADITDTMQILSPEIGQFTTVTATSLNPQFSVVSITNGNIAELVYNINATTLGTFDVQVTAFDDGVPPDTVTFNIVFRVNPNTTIPPSITASDTIICPGENTTLSIIDIYEQILWSNGDSDSSTIVNSGGMYYVTAINGGCPRMDSINIAAFPNPTPILNSVTQICNGSSDTLFVTNGPFVSYSWTGPATGTDSSLIVNTTGTYTVTVVDANGCAGNTNVTISISNPIINILGPSGICYNDSALLIAVPTIGFSSITWNDATTGPNNYVNTSGMYIVSGINSVGCEALDTFNLSVAPAPSGNITLPIFCEDQANTFTFTNTGPTITNYAWNFGSGPGGTSNIQNPTHVYSNDGTYNITLILTSNDGCRDTIYTSVVVHPPPDATITNTEVCDDIAQTFSINNAGDPIANYNWNFLSGTPSSSSSANPSVIFNTPGTYNIAVELTTTFGCTTTVVKPFIVHPSPTASIGLAPLCVTRYTIDNLSTPINDINSSTWYLGDGTVLSNMDTSTFNYIWNNPGTFTISLTIIDNNGCVDSTSSTLVIPDTVDLIVPNILVHSSTNGNNQFDFNLISPDFNLCVEYDFYVYDRWGVEVFNVHNDPQNPDLGCNHCFKGESKNKTTLTQGTYFYVLKGAYDLEKKGFIEIFD